MQTLADALRTKLSEAIRKAHGASIPPDSPLLEGHVQPATLREFGHYQCNSALKLAQELHQNPRKVAAAIVDALERPPLIETADIAGPGFINLTLHAESLSDYLNQMLHDDRLGIPLPERRQKIIVDFSSPNVAKELHVGHLRSTIIGDSLARLFEFLGHNVLRLNHVGDWGTQFGMLIAHMQMAAPDVLEGAKEADLSTLMQWYRESKKRFDDDPLFKKLSQQKVVELQRGDVAVLHAWRIICEISQRSYQQIYNLLDVHLTRRGESFYNPFLPHIVQDLEKRGLVTLSEGAKCIFLEGFAIPMIIQKSDGGYNYETTDMAALRHRIEQEHAERVIYVTDAGQSLHFQMVFAAAKKAHYLDPAKVRVDHVPFGVVLGPDGKKFKTRSGDTEKLIDLLLEAIAHAKRILQERKPDASEEELAHTAQVLGLDALKYADLSCHRLKDYHFSYDRMLKFEGNTAAYLLYSYVRIQGIKRKVGKSTHELSNHARIALRHPTEIALGLHLARFGEMLQAMAHELLPNRLAEYLYELSETFHCFFRDCHVEGSSEEASRLLLCETTGRVLAKGLDILGLKTIDRM